MNGSTNQISTMRLYGGLIGIVSGGYSLYLSTAGAGTSASAWFMLLLGLIVVLHGTVLLTPLAARLGAASGPLMIVYATLMLLNQGWMIAMPSRGGMDGGANDGMGGMNGGAGMSPDASVGTMGLDAGMVALALLMLASGVIMTARREMMPGE